MKRLVLWLLLAPSSIILHAQHATVVVGDISKYFLYEETFKVIPGYSGKYYEVWVNESAKKGKETEFKNKEISSRKKLKMKIIGFAKYDHEKTRFWFDCLNHSYKIIENIYYDSKGNVLDSDSANTGRDWNSCPPDSISDELCKSVCTYADLNNIY